MNSLIRKISQIFSKAKSVLANFYFFLKIKLGKVIKKKHQREFKPEQTQLDEKLVRSLSKSKIPSLKQFKYISKFLNTREVRLIKISSLVIIVSLTVFVWQFYKTHLKIVPTQGGQYIEGLIGTPQYINPLYASANDTSSDISRLVFSSLFRYGPEGELVSDLATGYVIGDGGKVYTITIREDVLWHNESPLTIDDVSFTFNAIKDNQYKSPLRYSFSGVSIEKVDNKTLRFILLEPYAAFLNLLTFGILPQDLWLQISPESASLSELNLKPIGSGPYRFKSLTKDKAGNIRDFNLEVNQKYYGQKPYIENISFKFFASFEEAVAALNENTIEGMSYLPRYIKNDLAAQDSLHFHDLNLPQTTAIFFNPKNNPENSGLSDKKIRQALARAIDKNLIISEVLEGKGRIIDGPILPDSFAYNSQAKKYRFNLEEASKLLDEAKWKKITITQENITQAEVDKKGEDDERKKQAEIVLGLGQGEWRKKGDKYLTITLTTVEAEDNIQVVEAIKATWEEIGIKTILNIVPPSQIQSQVIKPRSFQALFYGQVVGHDPDSYAFWHSSQVGESGLNLANFSNKEVDKLLEDARLTSDKDTRIEKYKKFQEILAEEMPAIFIYSPIYTYVQSKKINDFAVKSISAPHGRFANISDWYIETGKKIIW